MNNQSNISLVKAILININVIIGAGLFINPKPLTLFLGSWGFLAYLMGTIILIPVVLTFADLARAKPTAGGLYVYPSTFLDPFAGFLSGWCYFVGKSASAVTLAYTFSLFAHSQFSFLQNVHPKLIASLVVFTLVTLNILGMKIGGFVQWIFVSLKGLPIFFVLITSLIYLLSSAEPVHVDDFSTLTEPFSALPIAVFALVGFEVICSIAHLIKDPQKNVRLAIILSFSCVALIYTIFQLGIYIVLGNELVGTVHVPIQAYALKVLSSYPQIARLLNACVYASILGASFGMLTSNCFTLFKIAEQKHFPFSNILSKVTKENIPWLCLLIEASFATVFLILAAEVITLQNMTVFGMVTAYFICCISAVSMRSKSGKLLDMFVPVLATGSCFYILWLSIKRILSSGLSYYFLFVLLGGILLAIFYRNRREMLLQKAN